MEFGRLERLWRSVGRMAACAEEQESRVGGLVPHPDEPGVADWPTGSAPLLFACGDFDEGFELASAVAEVWDAVPALLERAGMIDDVEERLAKSESALRECNDERSKQAQALRRARRLSDMRLGALSATIDALGVERDALRSAREDLRRAQDELSRLEAQVSRGWRALLRRAVR